MSTAELGSTMAAEMAEQPAVLAQLTTQATTIADQVRGLGPRPRGVAFLARGSSDNAALLGRYAVELATGLPTCLLAPSLVTGYGAAVDGFAGWLIVALSQSGRTPEIVDLAHRYAAAGARIVAITNDSGSDLARAADVSVDLDAGPERAVPATKTVTAQMLALLAVVNGLTTKEPVDVSGTAGAATAVLADEATVAAAATVLARHSRLAVVGRGLVYPAAKETALKLQETTGFMAHGFSTADFRHGPIAVCGTDAPAVLIAGSGPVDADTVAVRADLTARDAYTVLISSAAGGDVALGRQPGAVECITATIRGQQLALAICRELGIDPDAPAGLNKVTLTH